MEDPERLIINVERFLRHHVPLPLWKAYMKINKKICFATSDSSREQNNGSSEHQMYF